MKYRLELRDAGNPPLIVGKPIMLLWTQAPDVGHQQLYYKIHRWLPLIAKHGTVVISRYDFASEADIYTCAADDIAAYTIEGDLVVDPFCGTSIVGAASLYQNRQFLGLDINNAQLMRSKERLDVIENVR